MRQFVCLVALLAANVAVGQVPSAYIVNDLRRARDPVGNEPEAFVPNDVLDELFLVAALENGAHAAVFRAKLTAAAEVADHLDPTTSAKLRQMAKELPPPLLCFQDGLKPTEGSNVPQTVWSIAGIHCDRPELKGLLERAAAYYGRYQESVGKTCQTEQLILLQEGSNAACQPNVTQLRAALWQLRGTKNALTGLLEGQFGYFATLKADWSIQKAKQLALPLRAEDGFTIDRLEREVPRRAAIWWHEAGAKIANEFPQSFARLDETRKARFIIHHYLLFSVQVESASAGYCGKSGALSAAELTAALEGEAKMKTLIEQSVADYFSHFRPRDRYRGSSQLTIGGDVNATLNLKHQIPELEPCPDCR